jgi:hypothetical protein
MDGGIITLPLRVGFDGARLLLRTAASAVGCAAKLGERVSDSVGWGQPAPTLEPPPGPEPEPAPPVEPPEEPAESSERIRGETNGAVADAIFVQPSPPPAPPPAATPPHVSEEPELVGEFAEPGAEDGVGATITIAEPWPGYSAMTAKNVIARLSEATPAELAAVELYESTNRDRQTVRAAAERYLKLKTGRGSPD